MIDPASLLPRALVIDDLFGRQVHGRRNEERADLCHRFHLQDVTGDQPIDQPPPTIDAPVAEAVFFRGQSPLEARVGDVVRNDLEATMAVVGAGWAAGAIAGRPWSLVLLDLCFYTGAVTRASDARAPGMPAGRDGDDDPRRYFGLQILKAIQERFPEIPVVILSSMRREEVSQQFAGLGAKDFIARTAKDGATELRRIIWQDGLILDGTYERDRPEASEDAEDDARGARRGESASGTEGRESLQRIVGVSPAILLALRQARHLVQGGGGGDANVLIRGETGTGKELMARYLHRQVAIYGREQREGKPRATDRQRRQRSLVVVNSAILTSDLSGSELFGHRKGSYTHGDYARVGRIVQADGGDLFFDEIGDMPMEVQGKLLRVLEDGIVTPVGDDTGRKVRVRFLSATNVNIEAKAKEGAFRSDLLARLREGGTITLPPLRERRADIPLLAWEFLNQALSRYPEARRRDIHPAAMKVLSAFDWPENIRQLRNCIINAVRDNLRLEHLMPVHLMFEVEPGKMVNGLVLASTLRINLEPFSDEAFNSSGLERQADASAPGMGKQPTGVPGDATAAGAGDVATKAATNSALESVNSPLAEAASLAKLLRIDFDSLDASQLSGCFPVLAEVMLRTLRGALLATRKTSHKSIDGEFSITRAVALLTSRDVTTSGAADFVKRLFSLSATVTQSLIATDTVLRLAYDKAHKLRPRSPAR